jgi:hypothetical protein
MGEVPVALGVPFHKNEQGVNRYGFFRVTKIGKMRCHIGYARAGNAPAAVGNGPATGNYSSSDAWK